MPARKTSHTSSTAQARRVQTTDEISYETKLVIVILLLLFVYPLGLIFMWFWMRNWPLWLKLLISIPVIFGILAICLGMFVAALFLRHAVTNGNWQYQMRDDQRPYMRMYRMSATPSATPSQTLSPTDQTTSY